MQILKNIYKNKKVKVSFREPFATIEKLIKLAKQGIAEIGIAEFKQNIISSYPDDISNTKKEPEIVSLELRIAGSMKKI